MTIKNCVICGEEFSGHITWITCSKICRKERQLFNSREQVRRWCAANPVRKREQDQKYRRNNPEKVNKAMRIRYAKNPEKHRERSKTWRSANPEKVLVMGRLWRVNNPEKERERVRRGTAKRTAAMRLVKELESKGIGALL